MLTPRRIGLLALFTMLGACAEFDTWTASLSKPATPSVATEVSARGDAIYVNIAATAAARDFRNVYIAPANLANMQVIQPEGGSADIEWWVTDTEDQVLQKVMADEFAAALVKDAAFYIVATPEEAQIIVNTAVVAIHPNVTRAVAAAATTSGGAISVSIALLNAVSNEVMVRVVDTQSTDDVWAFNQAEGGDPAFNKVFRIWGESVRRGLLELQGRSDS